MSITPKVITNKIGVIFNTLGLISFSPKQITSTQKGLAPTAYFYPGTIGALV